MEDRRSKGLGWRRCRGAQERRNKPESAKVHIKVLLKGTLNLPIVVQRSQNNVSRNQTEIHQGKNETAENTEYAEDSLARALHVF